MNEPFDPFGLDLNEYEYERKDKGYEGKDSSFLTNTTTCTTSSTGSTSSDSTVQMKNLEPYSEPQSDDDSLFDDDSKAKPNISTDTDIFSALFNNETSDSNNDKNGSSSHSSNTYSYSYNAHPTMNINARKGCLKNFIQKKSANSSRLTHPTTITTKTALNDQKRKTPTALSTESKSTSKLPTSKNNTSTTTTNNNNNILTNTRPNNQMQLPVFMTLHESMSCVYDDYSNSSPQFEINGTIDLIPNKFIQGQSFYISLKDPKNHIGNVTAYLECARELVTPQSSSASSSSSSSLLMPNTNENDSLVDPFVKEQRKNGCRIFQVDIPGSLLHLSKPIHIIKFSGSTFLRPIPLVSKIT